MTSRSEAATASRLSPMSADLATERKRTLTRYVSVFRNNLMALAGLVITIVFVFLAIFGSTLAPYDPIETALRLRLQGPSMSHLMGTDEVGRDVFSRLLVGARVSISIAVLSVGLAVFFGVALGMTGGYFGGRWDMFSMRLIDVQLAIPDIVLAIAIIGLLGFGTTNLIIAVSITRIPSLARLARASVMTVKSLDYVLAARTIGATHGTILVRHLLPNVLAPLVVQATLATGGAIIGAATLGFLGLGIQPPTPEWGAMLSRGREYTTTAPHVVIFPGLAIGLVVLGLNLLGDGLRDAMDPRLRHKGLSQ